MRKRGRNWTKGRWGRCGWRRRVGDRHGGRTGKTGQNQRPVDVGGRPRYPQESAVTDQLTGTGLTRGNGAGELAGGLASGVGSIYLMAVIVLMAEAAPERAQSQAAVLRPQSIALMKGPEVKSRITPQIHRAGRQAGAIKPVRRAGWEWAASFPAAKSCLG